MKIAVSSICWPKDTLDSVLAKAKALGFPAVELMAFWEHYMHGNLWEAKGAEFRRMADDHGLELVSFHLGAIVTSTQERWRKSTDYALKAIEVAVEARVPFLVFTGPMRNTPFPPFLKSLAELAPALKGTGVRIALENHKDWWTQYIQDYEHIFQHVDDPNIGITVDTGHFAASWIDPASCVRRFPSKMFHVHIKDLRGNPEDHQGPGETDNWGTVKALADIGYDGYLSQESEGGGSGTPEEKARRGFDYMTKLLKGVDK